MATQCSIGFDTSELRRRVLDVYARVAEAPGGDFHFHRGAAYASQLLGYDAAELETLPARATSRFAGVGNPISAGPIASGEVVLDHACGAGMDLLLAARRIGPAGRAIGVDVTPAMVAVARESVQECGLTNVFVCGGAYEELPVTTASIDVVLSNGVLNLAPDKAQVVREIFRVLKPGGRLQLADVVVRRELSLSARSDPELWAACIGGALTETELFEVCEEAGLRDGHVVDHYRSFSGTSAERRLARDLEVGAVSFFARKPG